MERDDMHELAIKQMNGAHMRMAEVDSVGDYRFEDGLQIERGAADDLQHFSGGSLLLPPLVQLAGEPRDLRFLADFRRTTNAHGFWCTAPLQRCRFAALRFGSFAARSGAPSLTLPKPQGKAS